MIKGINKKEQQIIEKILDKYEDYHFFYYGSRVKGDFYKTSDLDILIKGQKEMPLSKLEEIKEEFDKSDLPYIVNFCDFYSIDKKFYSLIKKDLTPYK
ncbi:nucleotidyltransferase domain-containing protein [bacterium]|nr:nucleotidyltransferase domain-containing protein [bacterium]